MRKNGNKIILYNIILHYICASRKTDSLGDISCIYRSGSVIRCRCVIQCISLNPFFDTWRLCVNSNCNKSVEP